MSKSACPTALAGRSDPIPADAPPAFDEAEALAVSVARVERRLRLLDELADMAMTLARGVTKRAVAAEEAEATTPASARDAVSSSAADDFAKLSRALRLTLDLTDRLEDALRRLRAGEASAREARRQDDEAHASRAGMARHVAARDKVTEQVAMVISRESESESDSSDLFGALEERLADDAAYLEIEDEPLREVVERLCSDLGLKPDWSRWTDEGWPDRPADVFKIRAPWSPFSQVSRKPVLT
jgi:hypothetical protein